MPSWTYVLGNGMSSNIFYNANGFGLLPIIVLVVILDSQEGVSEDVNEGHSYRRTQPAVKSGLSAVSQTLKLSYRPCLKHFSSLSIVDVFGWT